MMTFKKCCLVAVLVAAASVKGQVPARQDSRADLGCIVDMPIPPYRGIVWTARVSGLARVFIAIGPGGVPDSIEAEAPYPILAAMLKSALRAAVFLQRCSGQQLAINFVYRLAGDPADDPKNEIRFKGPDTFEIVGRPPVPHTEP